MKDEEIVKELKYLRTQIDKLNKPSAHTKAVNKYLKTLYTLPLRFNKEEQDLCDWLQQFSNKTEYIKGLIRKDMNSRK